MLSNVRSEEIDSLKARVPAAWLPALLIVVATLLAYSSVWGAGYIWDDDAYVSNNNTLTSVDGLRRIWLEPGAVPQYYPLTHTTFWIEHQIWGVNPRGYHATNVLMHGANALLVGQVLTSLAVPGAWGAAALFALHPVHVESVAWITERKNTLSGFFYLLALLAFLRFDAARQPEEKVKRRLAYIVCLGCFVASLLSKTVTATLPAALLILTWWRHGTVARRDWGAVAPMFVIGLCLSAVTVWMERGHVGAVGSDWDLSFVERCLIASRAAWFYLGKLAWPAPLIFNYPRWQIDAGQMLQYVPLVAAAAAAVLLYRFRGTLGRGPFAAALYFVATLGPALGFVNTFPMRYSFVADHFQYLASLGPLVLLASAATWYGPRLHRRAAPIAAMLSALVLTVLTWQQGWVYHDLKSLWHDTIAKNRGSVLAHNNLGLILMEDGQAELAARSFQAALSVKPNDGFAYNNLGLALMRMGDERAARDAFENAVRYDPGNAQAHNNLGNWLAGQGSLEAAAESFATATRLQPTYSDALGNLANVRMLQNRTQEAEQLYQRAIEIDPEFADALHNLAVLRAQQGRLADAEALYRRGIAIRPSSADAYLHLGYVVQAQGRLDEARRLYDKVRQLRPGDAAATAALNELSNGK